MNEIIKNIEAAQLKENVPSFNVGDTVKVYNKIKEGNRERIQIFLIRFPLTLWADRRMFPTVTNSP